MSFGFVFCFPRQLLNLLCCGFFWGVELCMELHSDMGRKKGPRSPQAIPLWSFLWLLMRDQERMAWVDRFDQMRMMYLVIPIIHPHRHKNFRFRHDTPAASPYGYTVKLAPEDYQKPPVSPRFPISVNLWDSISMRHWFEGRQKGRHGLSLIATRPVRGNDWWRECKSVQ